MKPPFASRPTSIRAKVTIASTVISAVAMLAIVVVTALITQSVLTRSISDTLGSHLDALQADLEAGTVNLSVEGAGAELIQAVDAQGRMVASSDWAWGVSALTDGSLAVGEERKTQYDQLRLVRGEAPEGAGSGGWSVVSGAEEEAGEGAAVGTDASAANASAVAGAGGNGSGRVASGDASGNGKKHASTNVYDATHDDDDDDDDDRDDGREDDRDNDRDDDDDDLRNATRGAAGNACASNAGDNAPNPFAPAKAYAAVPALPEKTPEGSYVVSASSLLGADGPFIVIERGISTPNGPVTLAAMASVASAAAASRTIALVLGGIMVVAVALVAVLSWRMSSRTLRPVAEMRRQVDDITASDLSLRIPVPQGDPDLASLAATFNRMLGRVEAAMLEQRRFISDASHELKSPVAATRIMLESARSHPENIENEALLADLSYENERMGGIVGNLLLLAQHDESGMQADKHPLDLCDLLYEEAAALRARSSLTVDVSKVEPVVCSADATMIRRAVRNLLDNAARYAKSVVKVSCREDDGRVSIVVSDDGPGVPEADRERIFGRFVRLEEGRGRKQGSTGLGLAVVRTIAEEHGGTARFVDSEFGGATVLLELQA